MRRLLGLLRRGAQASLLVTVSVSSALLLLELGVRLFAPQQLIQLRPDIWQPTEVFGWRHTPNADATINTGDGRVRFRTDAQGHRIGVALASEPAVRVLALGDSFVEAIQVEHEDTTTAQLETLLASRLGAPVRVVNTGVGGWGPDHYLLEARRELERTSYDAVVVFVFAGNDRVLRRRDHFYPTQVAAPRRFRLPRALTQREWVDAVAYPLNNALETRSHLFVLLKNRAKFLLMRVGLSAHHFPAALVHARNVADSWALTADALVDIRAEAQRRGLPLLVVLLPGIYQVDTELGGRYAAASGLDAADYDLALPATLLIPALDRAGLPWIDALPALRSAHANGNGPLYGAVDTHLAPAGHRVVAKIVAPALLRLLGSGLGATEPPAASAGALGAMETPGEREDRGP